MPLIFLSHSSQDKSLARRIASDLRAAGIDVWLDEWEILVGDSITQRISHGLEQATFVAVLLTESSIKSGWVEKEWQARIGQEAQSRRVAILPICADDCPVPTLLCDKRFADLRNDYQAGVGELIEAIQGHVRRNEQGEGKPAASRDSAALKGTKKKRFCLTIACAQASLHVIAVVAIWHLFQDWRQALGLPIEALPTFLRVVLVSLVLGVEVTTVGLYRREKWAWHAGVTSFVVVLLIVAGVVEYIQPTVEAMGRELNVTDYSLLFGPVVLASIVGFLCLIHRNSRCEFRSPTQP